MMLTGCGKKSGDQAAVAKGQVVAHVGDQVVTTQELENEFRLANVPAFRLGIKGKESGLPEWKCHRCPQRAVVKLRQRRKSWLTIK